MNYAVLGTGTVGIAASRGLEAWLLLWTRLYGVLGTGEFNLRLIR